MPTVPSTGPAASHMCICTKTIDPLKFSNDDEVGGVLTPAGAISKLALSCSAQEMLCAQWIRQSYPSCAPENLQMTRYNANFNGHPRKMKLHHDLDLSCVGV